MHLENETVIAAPVDAVWRLTENIEGWPSVTPTVTDIERLDTGALRVGSTARLTQPGLPPKVWTVTAFEPNERFEWETRIYGVRFTGRHLLEATGSGTRNTLVLDLTGPTSRLLGAMAGKKLRKSLAAENAGFKQHAESGSRPHHVST
jgi:uncharacterized membrane protein